MKVRLISHNENRRKKAISAVIGGLMLFGMIFTIGFGYFYVVAQDQQIYQAAIRQSNSNILLRNSENLYVVGGLVNGNLSFSVNNTGIPVILTAFFVMNQTGQTLRYASGNPSSSTPAACSKSNVTTLSCSLNQGSSAYFKTNIKYSYSETFTIKVITSRASTFVGTYPTQQITSYSVNSVVASGLGSLEMIFSSFNFYNYTNTDYNKVGLGHPYLAAMSPYQVPVVFSVQITNNDPGTGTIVVGPHTNLWIFASCGNGCGSQSIIFFYVMNVGLDGTITSTEQGSFVPIQIPYGVTKTIYFGSANDLSLNGFHDQQINDAIGEHDVFLIISGTKVTPANSTMYSQNLPFTATFTADNIASFSQSPYSCPSGSTETFALTVKNLKVSSGTNAVSGENIYKVIIQSSPFIPTSAAPPNSNWTPYYNANGTVYWTTSSGAITPGGSLTFYWTAKVPIANGTQYTFLSTAYFTSGGTVTSQPIDTGCYVS